MAREEYAESGVEPAASPPVEGDLFSSISPSARELLEGRYLRRDERGQVVETPDQMFRRVADHVASAEVRFGEDRSDFSVRFGEMMSEGIFLPNSPTLMNAGLALGQLSACFVIPIEDSMEGIFGALKLMAIVHQSGGGTGFSFSRLRPRGDVVRSTGGIASGPVSFMGIFDAATEVVRQGGRRRGANMGVLRADHPDVLDFVHSKDEPGRLENFNISVGIPDEFMSRAGRDEEIELFEDAIRKMREGEKDPQMIVMEEELESHLRDGWQFVSVLPSRKIVIRK